MFSFLHRRGFTIVESALAFAIALIVMGGIIVGCDAFHTSQHQQYVRQAQAQHDEVYVSNADDQPYAYQQPAPVVVHHHDDHFATGLMMGHMLASQSAPRTVTKIVTRTVTVPSQPLAKTAKIIPFPVVSPSPAPIKKIFKVAESGENATIRKSLISQGFDVKTANRAMNDLTGRSLERKIDLAGTVTVASPKARVYVRTQSTPAPVVNFSTPAPVATSNIVSFRSRSSDSTGSSSSGFSWGGRRSSSSSGSSSSSPSSGSWGSRSSSSSSSSSSYSSNSRSSSSSYSRSSRR